MYFTTSSTFQLMVDYKKKYIKTIRLNSFRPLCSTAIGLRAIERFGCLPFIDASCRREPDFENPNPSITALCRQELFAPKLYPNDIIIYMTVKGKWFTDYSHHRLIAVLAVIERKETHLEAKYRYLEKGLTVPSNCMVVDNPALSFERTGGKYEKMGDIERYLNYSKDKQMIIGERIVKVWDNEYLLKSKKNGVFIITKPIFIELKDPPILTDEILINIFGKVPNTRNPNIIKDKKQFKELLKIAGINFIES